MEGKRLVKTCLREELRALQNSNPSAWGKDLDNALEEWGGEDLKTVLERGVMEEKDFREKLGKLLETGVARDKEVEDEKIRNSTFNPLYKYLGRPDEKEGYWEAKEVSWGDKTMWARMRCGNIGRAGNKGYKDTSCRLCGGEREDLEHILGCDKVSTGKLSEWWRDWRRLDRNESIVEILKGNPISRLCKLVREWEKLVRGMGDPEEQA